MGRLCRPISVSIKYRHAGRCWKRKVYFVKSFSSLYDGTTENDFAKSKQRRGFLDEILAVLNVVYAGRRGRRPLQYFNPLAVDRLFRQSAMGRLCRPIRISYSDNCFVFWKNLFEWYLRKNQISILQVLLYQLQNPNHRKVILNFFQSLVLNYSPIHYIIIGDKDTK